MCTFGNKKIEYLIYSAERLTPKGSPYSQETVSGSLSKGTVTTVKGTVTTVKGTVTAVKGTVTTVKGTRLQLKGT